MLIDVAFTAEEAAGAALDGATAVVVDVVRASTTIVAALAAGAPAVLPVGSPEEARERARAWPAGAVLLGGERGGDPPPGFECGNSPAEYTVDRVRGRVVVFTTTNGTRALLAVAPAARVAVGGFVNASAVARWVASAGRAPVLLVGAGEKGRFCLEDAACTGLLVARLAAIGHGVRLSDSARAAALVWRAYADDLPRLLADAAWARALTGRGRGGDLPLCVAVDASALVPVVGDGGLLVAAGEPGADLTPLGADRHNEPARDVRGGDA